MRTIYIWAHDLYIGAREQTCQGLKSWHEPICACTNAGGEGGREHAPTMCAGMAEIAAAMKEVAQALVAHLLDGFRVPIEAAEEAKRIRDAKLSCNKKRIKPELTRFDREEMGAHGEARLYTFEMAREFAILFGRRASHMSM